VAVSEKTDWIRGLLVLLPVVSCQDLIGRLHLLLKHQQLNTGPEKQQEVICSRQEVPKLGVQIPKMTRAKTNIYRPMKILSII
jgi:hypothetical protein